MAFSDGTLQDMVGEKPRPLSEMLRVTSVGERMLDQHGGLFLGANSEVVSEK